jgi:hypothetical protein
MSLNVAVSGELVARAKDKELKVRGPVRLPNKRLTITTRKSVRIPLFSSISLSDIQILPESSRVVRDLRHGITSSFGFIRG